MASFHQFGVDQRGMSFNEGTFLTSVTKGTLSGNFSAGFAKPDGQSVLLAFRVSEGSTDHSQHGELALRQ